MNCNTTHYRANSSSVPGDPTLQFYGQPGDEDFKVPVSLTEEEFEELRATVGDMLDETRRKVAKLDRQIAKLKATVFDLPEPPDEPEEAPKATVVPEPAAPAPAETVDPPEDGMVSDEPPAADEAGLFPVPEADSSGERNAPAEDGLPPLPNE